VWLVFVAIGLAAAPASALPLIDSRAEAYSDESGEDPGGESDYEQATAAGASAVAETFRCVGSGSCALPPFGWPPYGARADATTNFGRNRARARGANGYDPNNENDVVDSAAASSLWTDDWTFSVPLSAVGDPVSLEFALDGSWQNDGFARFEAGVFDTTMPVTPNPDDPDPFLPGGYQIVAGLMFDSTAESVFTFPFSGFIPVEDGGEPDGSVDLLIRIDFVPVPGRTYMVAARLVVEGYSGEAHTGAEFGSTAELVRVVVPSGVSFESAAGASWNVEAPEPGLAMLAGAGLLAAIGARRLRV
jgi:hypothetical protein